MNPTALVVDFLRHHGSADIAGLTVLAGVFVFTGLVPIPRTVLCLASGAIFGMIAVLVIIPSTTIGGLIGFLLARYLLSEPLYRSVENRPKARAVLRAVDKEGWRAVGLLRFAGPLPTFSQNYLFGLTRIDWRAFAAATFVFTIPQVCLYVYLGATGRAILLDGTASTLNLALTLIGAACLIAVLALVMRQTRLALQQIDPELASTDEA